MIFQEAANFLEDAGMALHPARQPILTLGRVGYHMGGLTKGPLNG